MKLVDLLNAGFDATPWANFLERIMLNRSKESRESLFDFIEKWKAPLTEDGHFIAFKYVREDYMDVHTGTFDNHPGKTPSMPWEDVDPDPKSTCSRGLHVCASVYLPGYTPSKRVVAVKVDPVDVVTVPDDYNNAKMRVCRYTVVGEVDQQDGGVEEIEDKPMYRYDGLDGYDHAGYDSDGFDRDGYDYGGYDHAGYDSDGYDHAGYASDGYDRDGYDDGGYDRYAHAGYDSDGYDRDGYDDGGYDRDGYDDGGYDRDGYDHDGYDMDGHDEGGMDAADWEAIAEGDNEHDTPELKFERNGVVYMENDITDGVLLVGQRAYASSTGIPRSTLQGWLSAIRNTA
jgi:hypothetical protein